VDGPHSIAEEFTRYLRKYNLPACQPADNERAGGWTLMLNKLILTEWIITENCKYLIEGLPTLIRDEKKQNDIVKITPSIFDDCADSARYGLKSFLSPKKKPESILKAEKFSTLVTADGKPDFQRIYRADMEFKREKLAKQGTGGFRLQRTQGWRKNNPWDG